jgi:phage shock protein C
MSSSDNKLHLNRRHAVFGGVCAGLADYFNIDRLIIRIITIIATVTWWPTAIVYIVLYFALSDKKPSLSEMGESISNSRTGRHFKNVDYRKRIYKSRRDRKISGVCAGLANYFEISPFLLRAGALLSLFFGPFAIIAYIVAAIIMDRDPDEVDGYQSRRERRRQRRHERHRRRHGYDDYEATSATSYQEQAFDKRDLSDCTNKFSDLEKKLQRLEATITSKKFKLHSELKRMAT